MKNYEKVYENVFANKQSLERLKWDKITIIDDEPVESWSKKVKELVKENELKQFSFLVKFAWLLRKFRYGGFRWEQNTLMPAHLSGALGFWSKNYGNFNFNSISNDYINKKIFTYFKDFFPNLDLNNPFESNYEYPYEYMGFSHLVFVYQIPERLELLSYGEKQKMDYAKFADYVINYISCYNDEHGTTFEIKITKFCLPYIKFLNRPIYEQQSKRRTNSRRRTNFKTKA